MALYVYVVFKFSKAQIPNLVTSLIRKGQISFRSYLCGFTVNVVPSLPPLEI